MKSRLHRTFFPWLVSHFFEYWYLYLGAFLSLFGLHYISSELPVMAKDLGDTLISDSDKDIGLIKFILLAIGIIFFRTLSRLLFFYPARLQQRNLRMELVQRLEESYPRTYQHFNDGQLFQRLFDDLNRIRGFIGFALLQVGNILIAAFVFVPKIRDFRPEFLIAFSPMIISVVAFSFIIYFFQPLIKKSSEMMEDVQNFIIESYSAKKTIQNYHSEEVFSQKLIDLCSLEMKYFFLHAVGKSVTFPFVKIGVGVSLLWGAFIVKQNNLAVSDLIYFSSFIFLILEPFLYVSWIGVVVSHGHVAWTRIKTLVNDINQSSDKVDLDVQSINTVLWDKSVEIKINTNSWLVFVGETGSGKSYLLESLAEKMIKAQHKVSFIHQEPYLYNDTLINNIFLGAKYTEQQKQKALMYLKLFDLDVLASSDEDLLEMEIGENGKRVSGGQAKRIALVRSVISDVDIILWDDPFSSVDLILENQIMQKLKKDEGLKNKTFILSSHRLSTVRHCEEVIFLSKESGIQESGQVSKLLKEESRVSEFFKKQLA